jgi:Ca-activated chloride channel homolog
MNRGLAALTAPVVLVAWVCAGSASVAVQSQEAPRFRAGVALVPIIAVVRDSHSRLAQGLVREDFEVLENGRPRPIVDFRSTEHAPISVALLFDTSGSMRDGHLDHGKAVVDALLRRLDTSLDEAALFTFDKTLRQETPFTQEADVIRAALDKTIAWGQTSLYDAISETAKRLADRRSQRRAVIVLTDGVDTSSTLKPEQVSELASAVDVPVYALSVAPSRRRLFAGNDSLSDLARWTGGAHIRAHDSQHLNNTIAALMMELRQLYFLAIESATSAGWYKLEVRTKRQKLTVRARSGYVATR